MEFKNDLGLVGKIAAHAVMSGKYKDKDGNIKEILPVGPENSLDFDRFREDIGAFGGTDIDKEHPSAGADYYAGSLADGEITERNLEWSGTDDPTKDLTVTFKDDPGSNPFGQYSGLTILGHIQKTVMTSGTKGAVSNLELNYDLNNVAKNGYFTTTSPYPIYISQSDIASGQELDIPINGVGEGLDGSNTKPAIIHLKYNADKTMTISHEDGYVNDGNSAGATGANYSFVVELIATYSTQNAVSQLPSAINLFIGSGHGQLALSGVDDGFENAMDGIDVTFDDYVLCGNSYRFKASEIGIPSSIKIPKDLLTNGYVYDLTKRLNLKKSGSYVTVESNSHSGWSALSQQHYVYSLDNINIQIGKGSINFNSNVKITLYKPANGSTQIPVQDDYFININRITSYKI